MHEMKNITKRKGEEMTYLSNSRPQCHPLPRRRASLLDLLSLYRQRRALATMDDERLRDLGISREEAEKESRRPIWDSPAKKH